MAKGVKTEPTNIACKIFSDVLIPFASIKTVFCWITEDYFFFVSSDLPVLFEIDSLISVSDWMFLNL